MILYCTKIQQTSCDFRVNIGNTDEEFTLAFKSNMSLTAKYDVNGKILIVPILGNGDAVVDASKCVYFSRENKMFNNIGFFIKSDRT